ncbi:MAG: ATP phosphoribosyltransferase [Deltaproteobacteria bacterium]|nr:ATP phosphoribosyltransferase [Deltaproteobacteria bacterium]
MKTKQNHLTIALPKGRVLEETVALLQKAGVDCSGALSSTRQLIFDNENDNIRFMVIRSQDVPTFVEYGAADIGIAGKDVLLEQGKDLYEPLDLGIGFCRMAVAEPKGLRNSGNPANGTHLRVATKYPNITLKYFLEKGVQVELIKLYGSIEVAPLLGISERIVDLVSTGETLKKNGLIEVEQIMEVTAKLVCNRASLKTKPKRIKAIIENLRRAL